MRSVSREGAAVTGTSRGRSNSRPVCSTTSATLWPGCTLASAKRRRPRSKANRQRWVTSATGPARAIDVIGARPRRADEVDPLDQRAAAVLEPEQDHRGHDVVEVGRAERAGKAHGRMRVLADADEVDVASAVDLSS